MTKTKTMLFLIAGSILVLAIVGVICAQYVNTQNQNGAYNQTPQGYNGNYSYLPPNTASGYGQVPRQSAYPYPSGMGMGMMGGRYW